MKKNTSLFVLLVASIAVNAQKPIQTVLVGDTVKLFINEVRGAIQWQQSNDSIIWSDMHGYTDSIAVYTVSQSPTNNKYYRARISVAKSPRDTLYYSEIIRHKLITGTTQIKIGDWFRGGIVFYTDGNGHGLISPTYDQSEWAQWGCYGTSVPLAKSLKDGTGNTIAISSGCKDRPIAASICNDVVINEYNDWFLPAKDQLDLLFQQQAIVGGFSNSAYYSSSEFDGRKRNCFIKVPLDEYSAWVQNFYTGKQGGEHKYTECKVRCVRAF